MFSYLDAEKGIKINYSYDDAMCALEDQFYESLYQDDTEYPMEEKQDIIKTKEIIKDDVLVSQITLSHIESLKEYILVFSYAIYNDIMNLVNNYMKVSSRKILYTYSYYSITTGEADLDLLQYVYDNISLSTISEKSISLALASEEDDDLPF